jgi:DNA-binding NarL/FixJ family response regulator
VPRRTYRSGHRPRSQLVRQVSPDASGRWHITNNRPALTASTPIPAIQVMGQGEARTTIPGSELVVTLDTVKKRVGHVLGKLGAANRTEAVARARELSLIP